MNSDQHTLDALQRQIAGQQQRDNPCVVERVLPELAVTVADDAETFAEAARRRALEERLERKRQTTAVSLARMGARYADCTFESFQVTHADQEAVVRRLAAYDWERRPNVLLFGPKGTGKDHLLAALVRRATDLGVEWRNGLDLFGEWRDLVGGDKPERERDALAPLVAADVLALSDPLPPSGELTAWQQQMLARVVDGRYRALRPTWATLNVQGREDFESRLGPLIADRLRDGAVALFCNWPSYRRTAT